MSRYPCVSFLFLCGLAVAMVVAVNDGVSANPDTDKKPASRILMDAVSQSPWNAMEGFDWQAASDRLVSRAETHHRPQHQWHRHSWRYFDPSLSPYPHHPYYYRGNGPPPSLEDLTAWMWTTETMVAFSLLLLALTVVACCWFSHKIGEFLCTAAAGFLATVLLTVVLLIFVSQWF
jgi:hypothetical protein